MTRLPDIINQKINNAGAMEALAKGDEMSEELKPPKTIYLQWDADPLAENTWSEDRINDDDIKYTRSDMGKPAEITALKSLIERLIEAGDNHIHMAIASIRQQDKYYALVDEWQAMKGGVDFSKVPEVILPDELKLYNQEGE